MSWKISLLLTRHILWLLVNTLDADRKYPVLNRDNLTIPIQTQLSQKQNTFFKLLTRFKKSRLNFKFFKKKDDPYRFFISDSTDFEHSVSKCLKSLATEDTSTSNVVNVPKHYWNLHHSAWIKLINHCQRKLSWKVSLIDKPNLETAC